MEALRAAPAAVTKGAFAKLLNVSAGRVSQYISEGKLTGEALIGEGRNALINVAVATDQLRQRIDVGQRFGNGLETRLDFDAPDAAPAPHSTRLSAAAPQERRRDPTDDALREEKLRELRLRNQDTLEARLAKRGYYVRSDEVRPAMAALASGMLTVFEGGLGDLATAISAKFELPQRDVLHLLRQEFQTLRAKASDAARRRAQALPPLVVEDLPQPEDGEVA